MKQVKSWGGKHSQLSFEEVMTFEKWCDMRYGPPSTSIAIGVKNLMREAWIVAQEAMRERAILAADRALIDDRDVVQYIRALPVE